MLYLREVNLFVLKHDLHLPLTIFHCEHDSGECLQSQNMNYKYGNWQYFTVVNVINWNLLQFLTKALWLYIAYVSFFPVYLLWKRFRNVL